MREELRELMLVFPVKLREKILTFNNLEYLQEIRIRVDGKLTMYFKEREVITDYACTSEDINFILQRMINYSIYAFEEEIRQGYITLKGGHRVGICGRCILDGNRVKTIKEISSLNIRIAREILGCSNKVIKFIINNNEVHNTLIISPPKCGKTTLLRDISRNISNGFEGIIKGKKVCIIDERSEIASSYNGKPQLNVGTRTDVLDSCPKSEGINMCLRSMAPDVIICDELGSEEDIFSIIKALNSGVSIITSMHGYDLEDVKRRMFLSMALKNNVFDRAIVLNNINGAGGISRIYDLNRDEVLL